MIITKSTAKFQQTMQANQLIKILIIQQKIIKQIKMSKQNNQPVKTMIANQFIFEQQQYKAQRQGEIMSPDTPDSSGSPTKLIKRSKASHKKNWSIDNGQSLHPIQFQNDQRDLNNNANLIDSTNTPNQIITNIIKVKSLPRIKNRAKIVISQQKQAEEDKKQNKLQTNHDNDGQQNIGFKQWKLHVQNNDQNQCKSQSSSNRETKPTKTIQEHEIQDGIQEVIYINQKKKQDLLYLNNNYDVNSYEKQKKRSISENTIHPRNAKRQLGQSDEENSQDVSQEEQAYEDENYDSCQYQQKMKAYKPTKRQIQTIRKSVNKIPPIQIKFDYAKLERFIKVPIKPGYMFQSIIHVQSGFLGMGKKYHLKQKFESKTLISAKKEIMSLTPIFIMSMNKDNHSRRHQSFVGIMQSNFSGTCWSLQCPIIQQRLNQGQVSQSFNKILLASYNQSIMGSKSLREMRVQIVNPSLPRAQRQQVDLVKVVGNRKKKKINELKTSKPTFTKGKYQLDFKGIAKIASSKNFILQNEKADQCLIFAKQTQQTYQMNVSYPLSLIQGFSLCLASLDGKLLVN